MNYLSLCSGIEAASQAWHPLGWKPVAFSEIEPFPSAVLSHHYPETPNLGDMTAYEQWKLNADSIDLLVGGTPCQPFSLAGLRKDWKTRVEISCSHMELLQSVLHPNGSYGKTSPESCHPTEGGILEPSSGCWQNSGMGSPTGFWTHNSSEHNDFPEQSHSAGGVCSLSDILETGDVPQRFYLSPKACAGILRRAEKRGKALPEMLRRALESVSDGKTNKPA